jgi:hypothetical protein
MVEKSQQIATRFDYSKDYTFESAQLMGTLEAIFVFCSKLTYHTLTLQYYYFCEPYFSTSRQKLTTMLSLSLLVMAINMLLNWTIAALARLRRYKTTTAKSRFLILNTFVLNFVNSALLILLIRVEIAGLSLKALIGKVVSLPEDKFSIETYSGFTRKWYVNIGSQIVLIYAVSLVAMPFLQIAVNWGFACLRAFRARRAKTQYKMNEMLMDN